MFRKCCAADNEVLLLTVIRLLKIPGTALDAPCGWVFHHLFEKSGGWPDGLKSWHPQGKDLASVLRSWTALKKCRTPMITGHLKSFKRWMAHKTHKNPSYPMIIYHGISLFWKKHSLGILSHVRRPSVLRNALNCDWLALHDLHVVLFSTGLARPWTHGRFV